MELYFKSRTEWRQWLSANFRRDEGIWMINYKKSSGKESILYDEAVEEALCFGWIDGKIKRIDDERYQQWYSPRRKGSRWSVININRVEKLVTLGMMEAVGLVAFRELLEHPELAYDNRPSADLEIPPDLYSALCSNSKALQNFMNFTSASRNLYIRWLESARRDETRHRRIGVIVTNSEANIRPGIM